MSINATLLGQMITFVIFVAFTMKFIWPPIVKALEERKLRIAEGLAAADRSVRDLEIAQHKAAEVLRDAKIQAAGLIDNANKRSSDIVEASKNTARMEGERLLLLAQEEIAKEVVAAKAALREQMAQLVVSGAARVLGREIDTAANSVILNDLIKEI